MGVQRLNHAVLYVSDVPRSVDFYRAALGMEVVDDLGQAAFLRLPQGANHHDLGLFSSGPAPEERRRRGPGLYHLAWEVDTFDALVEHRAALLGLGALVGESDHGVSLSLYSQDPDGIEFEVMWTIPREAWGEFARQATTRRLDWADATRRWGTAGALV
jgi:catechol-2,3-dioxygenase